MFYFDCFRVVDVSDRTGDTEYSVVDSSRQLEFFDRCDGDLGGRFGDLSIFFYVDVRHLSIGVYSFFTKSSMLMFLCLHDDFFEISTGYVRFFFANFANFDTRNLDEYIDPIEYRSRET